jgi:transcriptional regulator with XRE-family HTH domain
MLAGLLRTVADVLLADSARGRMARQLLRGFIIGDGPDIRDGPVRSLPQPPDGNVPQSSDSPPRTAREHAPARTKPVLAASDWPDTAAAIRERLSEQGVSQQALARHLGVPKTAINKAIGPQAKAPSEALQNKLRAWVGGPKEHHPPAAIAVRTDHLPATMLSGGEQARLSGYLSGLASDRDLRRQFQATRDVIEAAASGAELATEIIGKVRQGLANGAG